MVWAGQTGAWADHLRSRRHPSMAGKWPRHGDVVWDVAWDDLGTLGCTWFLGDLYRFDHKSGP